MRIACNSVAREGKGREAALASGVHALHLPVPVPRAAAPLPANTPAGSNPRAASYIYRYRYRYRYTTASNDDAAINPGVQVVQLN